ncbi:MAG: hypothetical protein HY403_04325 [Elusimicrobia bacterium]|nr:hypothetical protein [Elusimicrobiota bacterium]
MKAALYGILLLAHGGDPAWNGEVERLRARVDAKVPVETALGMADPAALQAAVDRLERRGVARIIAVPLFVQSRSEVLDQTRYALGLAERPSEVLKSAYERMAAARGAHAAHSAHSAHRHEFSLARVRARAPIAMTRALDDHALVGRILNERARALSRDASRERLILVAHGPVDDAAVPAWRESLASLCAAVKGFRACGFGLLRDDAAPEIRAAAVADLRAQVARAKTENGRALVVPVLIARGGIEKKIVKDLAGLEYAWDGRALMPHPGFDSWVLERAAAAAGR